MLDFKIYETNSFHQERDEDNYLKKTRRDAVDYSR